MKRYLSIISIFLVSISIFAEDEVTIALQQVAKNNLTLKALLHESEANVLDTKAGNALGGPSVEYSPFYKKGYSGLAESELIVKEDFDFPTKYAARNKLASLQKETGAMTYERQRRDILLEAKLLCLDIIRINQTLQMLHQRLTNSETLNTMYQKRLDAGDANILDVNKVRLDCMEVKTLCSEAENERSTLLQQLQQLNGGIAIDIAGTKLPEIDMHLSYEDFINQAMAQDASIREAEANVKTMRQDVSISRQEWLPNLSVGYRRNTEMKEAVNGFMVGVSFPLLGNGSKVKAAQHRQQSAELQLQQLQQDTESSLRSRYMEMQNLQHILDHSDVEMMQEMLQLLSKALQHGEITALQYYTEINSIYEKIQRHIDVHCQMVKLHAELYRNNL